MLYSTGREIASGGPRSNWRHCSAPNRNLSTPARSVRSFSRPTPRSGAQTCAGGCVVPNTGGIAAKQIHSCHGGPTHSWMSDDARGPKLTAVHTAFGDHVPRSVPLRMGGTRGGQRVIAAGRGSMSGRPGARPGVGDRNPDAATSPSPLPSWRLGAVPLPGRHGRSTKVHTGVLAHDRTEAFGA